MEDIKEEEEEAKQYREFQNRQVQSLLELREAQADAETERRLEHLRQVRGLRWKQGEPASGVDPSALCYLLAGCLCPPRVSSGSGRLSWMHTQPSSRD